MSTLLAEPASTSAAFDPDQQRAAVRRVLARSSFCTLATSSAAGAAHVVGVLYAAVDGVLYVNTSETSVKVRNIRANPRVAVCIPVRRLPFFPPSCVQFQGTADILAPDDPHIVALLEAGRLRPITSHGELDLPGCCFLRITPSRRISSFGIGMGVRQLLRDPLGAGRTVELA